MSIGIYKITSPSNKTYIGQSVNIEKRWKDNYKTLNCKQQVRLYYSLKKYGAENHIFEIIEECEESKLLERETSWKIFYKVLEIPSLCCKIDGKGGNLSQETKDKISKGLLKANIKRSEKTKIQIQKNMPNSKKVFQFDLNGELIKIWNSIKDVQRNNKGNIKNNILGKTKQSNGYIWLREEDKHKINERIERIQKYIDPKIGLKRTEKSKELMSQNIKGKKIKCKTDILNLELIKEQYKTLSTNQLAELNNISIPTMLNYLKNNGIYQFRNNYMK